MMIGTSMLFALYLVANVGADETVVETDYGVDCSFPIHGKTLRCGDRLGDRKKLYEDFMQGCRDFYGRKGDRCDAIEEERIAMSRRQPRSMVSPARGSTVQWIQSNTKSDSFLSLGQLYLHGL